MSLGFPVIVISPDQPSKLETSLEVKDLGYGLYSDNEMNAARAFGIAFKVNAMTHTGMKLYGINIEEASGETHRQLPVPSVFLVEAGGTIRWVYSNADYKIRPDNAQVIEAARKITAIRSTP